jgi:hypothetical protein
VIGLALLRAGLWFVLLIGIAFALDATDRVWRHVHLQAALAATPPAPPAGAPSDAPAMPRPVDVLEALQPLPADAWAGSADDPGRLEGLRTSVEGREQRLVVDGVAVPVPGRLVDLARAADGVVFATIGDPGRLPLWMLPAVDRPWRPIGGSGPVKMIAPGEPGILYAAGGSLGRWDGRRWTFTAWPAGFRPVSLRAHPAASLVVALGDGRVAVSRDGGATLRSLPLAGRRVARVGLDASDATRLLLMFEGESQGYALDLGAWP